MQCVTSLPAHSHGEAEMVSRAPACHSSGWGPGKGHLEPKYVQMSVETILERRCGEVFCTQGASDCHLLIPCWPPCSGNHESPPPFMGCWEAGPTLGVSFVPFCCRLKFQLSVCSSMCWLGHNDFLCVSAQAAARPPLTDGTGPGKVFAVRLMHVREDEAQ